MLQSPSIRHERHSRPETRHSMGLARASVGSKCDLDIPIGLPQRAACQPHANSSPAPEQARRFKTHSPTCQPHANSSPAPEQARRFKTHSPTILSPPPRPRTVLCFLSLVRRVGPKMLCIMAYGLPVHGQGLVPAKAL